MVKAGTQSESSAAMVRSGCRSSQQLVGERLRHPEITRWEPLYVDIEGAVRRADLFAGNKASIVLG